MPSRLHQPAPGHAVSAVVALAMAAAPLTFALVASAQMGTATSSSAGAVKAVPGTPLVLAPVKVGLAPSGGTVRTLVGGLDQWVAVASYQIENTTDAPLAIGRMDLVQASAAGDAADFQAVAVRRGIDILPAQYTNGGWSLVSGMTSNDFYAPGSKAAFLIAPKTKVSFDLVAKLSAPVAGAAVGDAWVGVARSGHAPSLRLSAFEAIDATMKPIPASVPKEAPPAVVLRKSYPTLARMPLATNLLENGSRQLYRFSVAAAPSGTIAWKQLQFAVKKTGAFALSDFRLYRGAIEVPADQVTVRARCGGAWTGAVAANAACDRLSIQWNTEETVSSAASVAYTLQATVSGAVRAASLDLAPLSTTPGNTARIVTGRPTGGGEAEYRVRPVFPAVRGIAAFDAGFLWSDLSAVPHSAWTDTKGGTPDWSDGSYLSDLPSTAYLQTLSRP